MGSLGSRRVGERKRACAWVSVCVWFGWYFVEMELDCFVVGRLSFFLCLGFSLVGWAVWH